MTVRIRKFIGMIALVAFIVVYALLAMEIGAARFAEAGPIAQAIYFVVAGLAWVLPAGLLVRWSQKPVDD